jgi:hypothetical protein
VTTIEINRGEDSFKGIDEKALLTASTGGFLAAAEAEVSAEVECLSCVNQVGRADEMILDEGKLALGEPAEMREEPLADEPAENRISQKLETFVIGRRAVGDGQRFIGLRAVCQCPGEQRLILERVTERPLQFFERSFQILVSLECGRTSFV